MSLLQKGLVITQFTASIALLIVVVFMQKQVHYIIDYDLGFNKENVMYLLGHEDFRQDFQTLEEEMLQFPSITAVSKSNVLPTQWMQGQAIKKIPWNNSQPVLMEFCEVGTNYFDFFEMIIVDGENPFYFASSVWNDIVINESAAQSLGYENPIGEMLEVVGADGRLTIRGVVRNVHAKSLHQEVEPQIYMKFFEDDWWGPVYFKINGNPKDAISFIEQKWKERVDDYPFEYHFLDDTYKQLYTSEMNAGKVFFFAMLISMIISVAGLFAMAYYATQRRLREIAIRKVYGASIKDIFTLLNKSFVLWVCIAFAIACPIAYFGLQKWLGEFVVKTPLNVWVFLLVGFVALAITLLTTGFQTWKVARANPVEAIKTE